MRLQTKTWPVSSTNQYALTQDCVAGESLILEGTNSGPFPSINYGARTVTLTSPIDLSGIDFTIKGFYYGVPSTVVAAGPNANTIEAGGIGPGAYFDSIVSIVPNTTLAGAQISAGTGFHGNLNPFLISAALSVINVSCYYDITGTLTFNEYVSLSKPNKESPDVGVNEDHFRDILELSGVTATSYASLSDFPLQMLFVEIIDSDNTGALAFQVLQSGISDA